MSNTTAPARRLGLCQICEREIPIVYGVIDYHGYYRPGWGDVLTESCFGGLALPLQDSCLHARREAERYRGWAADTRRDDEAARFTEFAAELEVRCARWERGEYAGTNRTVTIPA